MIVSVQEKDREVVSAFLNKQIEGEVFSPSVTSDSLIEGDKGTKIFMPLCEGDCYLVNGVVCMSVLSIVLTLNK